MATAAALAAAVTCPLSAASRLSITTARSSLRPSGPPSWIGLKHLGISVHLHARDYGVRSRGRAVYASLFGVGAPEALVIGVVALLVFGPKGLAEVARNLGKTLRAFQPTIRELQEVSREFKTTLEREIGLDEVPSSLQSTYKASTPVDTKPSPSIDQNGVQPNQPTYPSEELLKITEEQLAASASGIRGQGGDSEATEIPTEISALPSLEAGTAPTALEAIPSAAVASAESTAQSSTSEEKLQEQ